MKKALTISMALMMAACAGNKGDFGLNTIKPAPPASRQPEYKDEKTDPRINDDPDNPLQQPSLGVEIKTPRRNLLPTRSPQERAALSVDDVKTINDSDLSNIPHLKEYQSEGRTVYHSHDGMEESRKRSEMQYVRSGYVIDPEGKRIFDIKNNKWQQGSEGYVYYKGTNPSQALPLTQKITYKGTWDYTTDAVNKRDSGDFSDSRGISADGNRAAGTSYSEEVNHAIAKDTKIAGQEAKVGHTGEFEIDFANKKMTGNLYSNMYVNKNSTSQTTKHRYSIEAKLYGNRFRGKTLAQDKNSTHFKSDGVLEGGFYGPNAEELAGKFLAEDNSLFGVFAGRQTGKVAEAETVLDAVSIKTEGSELKTLDNFGNASKLFINGTLISLLPQDKDQFTEKLTGKDIGNGKSIDITVCCSNTDYLKFGWYYLYNTADAQNKTQYLFLQGERTPVSVVAALSGTARYSGSWDGIIRDGKGNEYVEQANNKNGGSRAVFNVDFSSKILNGELYRDNGATSAIDISGKVQGNGFTGTAKTHNPNGFAIDPGSTGDQHLTHIKDAEVKGGFYGPGAAELGGYIHGGKAGGTMDAVFGAKRQIKNEP